MHAHDIALSQQERSNCEACEMHRNSRSPDKESTSNPSEPLALGIPCDCRPGWCYSTHPGISDCLSHVLVTVDQQSQEDVSRGHLSAKKRDDTVAVYRSVRGSDGGERVPQPSDDVRLFRYRLLCVHCDAVRPVCSSGLHTGLREEPVVGYRDVHV